MFHGEQMRIPSTKKYETKNGALNIYTTATNWTFGIWWIRRRGWYGLDLGPMEIVYRKRYR